MAAVTFRSFAQTQAGTATSVVVTKPSGLAVGDIMVGTVAVTASASGSTNHPSGWTDITGELSGGANQKVRAFYKIADSADVAASDFTFTGSGTDCIIGGAIYAIIPGGISTVIDAFNSAGYSGTSINIAAGVTPTRASDLYIMLGMAGSIASEISTGVSSEAIATSNPSWTNDYDNDNAGTETLPMFGSHATRPEVTPTGNVSFTYANSITGGMCILIAVANHLEATVAPSVIQQAAAIQEPAIAGGGTVVVSAPVTATASVQEPSVGQAAWNVRQRSSAASWTPRAKS